MLSWKVVLEHNERTIELVVKARSYADAFINSQLTYSGCRVISIKPSDPVIIEGKGDIDKN